MLETEVLVSKKELIVSRKIVVILTLLTVANGVACLWLLFEPEIYWGSTEKSISVYVGEDQDDSGAYLYYDCGWSANRSWETGDGNWGCGYSIDP